MPDPHTASPRQIYAASAGSGLLAAGQALLWIRVLGSANDQRPETLGHALGFVLLGLALGAFSSAGLQARLGLGVLRHAALLAALAGAIFYVAMPVGTALMLRDAAAGRVVIFLCSVAAAAAMGGLVPLLCRSATDSGIPAGSAVVRVLVAHLLGAAAAPIVVGYVTLDVETLEHTILFVALGTLALAQALWLLAPERRRRAGVTVFALASLAALVLHERLFHDFVSRLHFGPEARTARYALAVQGRAGVVGVLPDGREYGDGLYDGTFSLDPAVGTPLIGRAFFVPALHRAPRRVLQVGLGSGVWARLLADARGVDSLTIVEANPAYVDMLWRRPPIAGVLEDPKVRLHFGDARRWLARHPGRRFDVIVVNGPWHWRAGATHLMSSGFLRDAKARLAPGGVVYFNTTGSLDAFYTAAGVFRHVVRVANFAAASDAPFDQTRDERRSALLTVIGPDGTPRIRGADAERTLDAMLAAASEELAPALRRANDLWNITDDNMASEFKAVGAGAWWRALPARVWRPDRAWPTVLF